MTNEVDLNKASGGRKIVAPKFHHSIEHDDV